MPAINLLLKFLETEIQNAWKIQNPEWFGLTRKEEKKVWHRISTRKQTQASNIRSRVMLSPPLEMNPAIAAN